LTGSSYEEKEKGSFQPVIHEEVQARHDADEQPTIEEDTLFARITGPKTAKVKSMEFDDEDDN
jgi:hypothetical protein